MKAQELIAASNSPPAASFWQYLSAARPEIEQALVSHLPGAPLQVATAFNEAVRYALFPGGKRLRPLLTLLGAEAVGGAARRVMRAAAAVEYIHTSSLIFDDLPCMDDANLRRGRISLHLRYGEGLAVLVGLALLNTSYGIIFECDGAESDRPRRAAAEMVECVGVGGMITGQLIDLGVGTPPHEPTLRGLKTTALIRFALRLGANLAGADEGQLEVLSRYAELLGETYQMSDDLLDLEEDGALAKEPRPETLVRATGQESVRRQLASLSEEAKDTVRAKFGQGPATSVLCEMVDYVSKRES
jgi:geranylgeranyl diphosphate synthase type II